MVKGTHYFYIIWLPLRKRQYAVVLQWLGCGQGQGLKAKAKATTPKADILWPQAKAKAKAQHHCLFYLFSNFFVVLYCIVCLCITSVANKVHHKSFALIVTVP